MIFFIIKLNCIFGLFDERFNAKLIKIEDKNYPNHISITYEYVKNKLFFPYRYKVEFYNSNISYTFSLYNIKDYFIVELHLHDEVKIYTIDVKTEKSSVFRAEEIGYILKDYNYI